MSSASMNSMSFDDLRWSVYGPHDAYGSGGFVDAQPYDFQSNPQSFFTHSEAIDPQTLLLDNPPLGFDFGLNATDLSYLPESQILFDNQTFGWPQEPYVGQWTIPEIQQIQDPMAGVGGELPATQVAAARSCSPASDTSVLSDGVSSASFSDSSAGLTVASNASAGSSGSIQYGQLIPGLGVAGPVRRGRGRPRKDAPPVYQPPPLCTYIDPLTNERCGKLLNRHHDLPRHMVKHRQEEAALVNAGRLQREYATLLPADWKHTDELKLPCRFCPAMFSRADAVTRHEKREHRRRPHKG